MKSAIRLLAMLPLLLSMSCGKGRPEAEAISERLEQSDGWGLVDSHGRLIADAEFKSMPSAAVNGYFSAADSNGKVSVYRLYDRQAPVKGLTGLDAAGYMVGGLIPVVKEGKMYVSDVFGRMRFAIDRIGDKPAVTCRGAYSSGLLGVAADDGLWGAVDREGKTAVAPIYYSDLEFSAKGIALATRSTGNEKYVYSFIDTRGKELYRFPANMFPSSYIIKEGMISYVTSAGRRGLVDCKGRIITLPPSVREIHDFSSHHVIYADSLGFYGLMTTDGNVRLRARYRSLDFGCEGELIAGTGTGFRLIDYSGKQIANLGNADEVRYIGSGAGSVLESRFCYALRRNSFYALYDRAGARSSAEDFESLDIYGITDDYPGKLSILPETATEPYELEADSTATDRDSIIVPNALILGHNGL